MDVETSWRLPESKCFAAPEDSWDPVMVTDADMFQCASIGSYSEFAISISMKSQERGQNVVKTETICPLNQLGKPLSRTNRRAPEQAEIGAA